MPLHAGSVMQAVCEGTLQYLFDPPQLEVWRRRLDKKGGKDARGFPVYDGGRGSNIAESYHSQVITAPARPIMPYATNAHIHHILHY